MNAEQFGGVGPGVHRAKAGPRRQGAEFFHGIFIRVFGVDKVVLGEAETSPRNPGRLLGEAADVDFDPAFSTAVECQVLELIDVEVAVELAIDAFEEVKVERGGHPGSVVVGGLEDVRLFLQIDADQHFASRPEDMRVVGEKRDGGIGLKIAYRRAGEKSDPLSSSAG